MRKYHWKARAEETFEAGGRALLIDSSKPVLHALYCSECGLQGQAILALELVGWTVEEYIEALWQEELKAVEERG